jgi:antitoxin ParD1/3/4
MNVSLTPELENFVNEKVKSGLYNSASEVLRESLRLLKERDMLKEIQLNELRREIMIGVDQIRNGEYTTYQSKEDFDRLANEIKTAGRARLSKIRGELNVKV